MRFFAALLTAFLTSAAAAQAPPGAAFFPESTVVYAEISSPETLINTIWDHPIRKRIVALEQWQQITESPDFAKFQAGLTFFEVQMNMDWRSAIEELTMGGIYIGVDAKTEGLALVVRAKNKEVMEQFRTRLLELTRFGQTPEEVKKSQYRGIPAYKLDNSKVAVHENCLVLTNKSETGIAVLDRLLDGGDSFADQTLYQRASESADMKTVWSVVDLDTLRSAGAAKNLFGGESGNPGVEILIGGILDVLEETTEALLTVDATQSGFDVDLSVPLENKWVSEERKFYFGEDLTGRSPALPSLPDTLFTFGAFRDVSEMWLRAGDLFGEQINDGIAEADASLTTLFAGRDFGEEILGSLTPEIGFIATKQDFTKLLPRPTIKLPAFALVLEMREPETMTRELRRTFQSMVGFFNVIGAMEGRPQLEMDMEQLDNGAKLITSTYVPEEDETESTTAPIIFNFSPSVAFKDSQFIVSSTDELARTIAKADRDNDRLNSNTDTRLYASTLREVLDENREQLIAQNMIEEGNTREEAEAGIGLLLEIIGYFNSASLKLHAVNDRLTLNAELNVSDSE